MPKYIGNISEEFALYNKSLNYKTLAELIQNSIHLHGERPFLGVKKNGAYTWMTYSEFDIQMRKTRTLFKSIGLAKGDRIAIVANNSIEFALVAYAAYGIGAVVVPMYEVQKLTDWEFIFGDSKPRVAVAANDTIREKIEGIHSDGLEKIWVINPKNADDPDCFMRQVENQEPTPDDEIDVTEDDLADIIYTSGTTGRPRGVMLTHKNIVTNSIITAQVFDISCNDRVLAFLPWAHAFGKTVDFHIFPSVGSAIGLAESPKTIVQNLLEVNPTILSAVPKIFNKIYDTVHLRVEDKAVTRFLFGRTEQAAQKSRSKHASILSRFEHKVLDKVVASKVRSVFGNSLRFVISGGASLSKEVAQFFDDFGVKIYEGCGMTEHAPIVSVNIFPKKRIGSVGVALPGVKVEIEHDNEALDKSDEKCGEIVITSDCVMKGYYNDPVATAAAIDEKGRLHTGDMGYVDEDGFLWITGRVKEQYKLENGKYVVPTALEEKINNSTQIDLSVVFGSGKPCNVVLIRPSDECIQKFRAENHLENATREELEENPKLRELISEEIQMMTADFRGYEKPQKFAITLEDFTIQSGLMTPALKIKRREVEKRFADVLAKLYLT